MTEATTDETTQRRGVSWEILGILAVVAVFLIMFLIWALSPGDETGVQLPDEMTLSSELGLQAGLTEEGRPYLGDPEAATTVYEFGDFGCTGSAEFANVFAHSIHQDYLVGGSAKLVWVNLPLLGEESRETAKAAICAADEGRFWDLYDTIFYNQGDEPLDMDTLSEMVEAVGLDWSIVEDCMSSDDTSARLVADEDLATEKGITSTPTFVVGDEIVVGNEIGDLRLILDSTAEM